MREGRSKVTQGGAKMKQVLIPVVFLLLFAGCGVSNEPNVEPGVELKLTVKDSFGQEEDTFTQGEDIEFILSVTNHTNKNLVMYFPGLELRVTTFLDIEILNTRGSFGGGGSSVVVKPDETLERSATWDQRLFTGEILPPGDYTTYVSFTSYPVEGKQSITIQ